MKDEFDDLIANTPAAKPDEIDALIASTPARQAPSVAEAVLRNIKQGGSFSLGNEIGATIGAPLLRLALSKRLEPSATIPPAAQAEAARLGIELPQKVVPTTAELYTTLRDADTKADEAATAEHPIPSFAANLAGGVAASKVLGSPFGAVGKGAPLLTKVLMGAANAAPGGMLFGLGSSKADLFNPYAPSLPTGENLNRAADDVESGGALAALVGGAIPLGGAVISKLPGALKAAGKYIGKQSLGAPDLPEGAIEQALKTRALEYFGTAKGAAKRLYKALSPTYGATDTPSPRVEQNTRAALEAAKNAASNSHGLGYDIAAGGLGMTHGGLGHGPIGLLAGPAAAVTSHALRTRGPQTLARGLYDAGSIGEWLQGPLGKLPNPTMSIVAATQAEKERQRQLALAEAMGMQ